LFLNDASGGYKLVGAAAQSLELATRFGEIRRLVEPLATPHEDLIGADDQPSGKIRRDLSSLGVGQSKRASGCRPPIRPEPGFDRRLIDPGWFNYKLKTCISEQSLPRRARRGKDQTLTRPGHVFAPTVS
jgi:hypothetical protein